MKLCDLRKIVKAGEDSSNQFKADINNSEANLFKSIIHRVNIDEPINELKSDNKGSQESINEPINLLLRELKNNPKSSYDELGKILSVSRSTVMRNIKILKDFNRIKYIGSKKNGYWEIIDKK